jgi:hypothetical protein
MTGDPRDVPGYYGSLITYAVLAWTGGVALVMATPVLLVDLRIIDEGSLQGLMMLIGIWLGLPFFLSALVAATLSLIGLLRGPWTLRRRLALWWLIAVGGFVLSDATTAWLSGGHALLVIIVGLTCLLPCLWIRRTEYRPPPPRYRR